MSWCHHLVDDAKNSFNQSVIENAVNPLIWDMILYKLLPYEIMCQLQYIFDNNQDLFKKNSLAKKEIFQLSFTDGQSISLWENRGNYTLKEERICLKSMNISNT